MKKTFYADCIVVIDLSKSESYSKETAIEWAQKRIKYLAKVDSRQQSKADKDVQALTNFIARIGNGEKIGFVVRQYMGHKYTPNKVDNKWPILYIGFYCYW
jgi:hypothetical protein